MATVTVYSTPTCPWCHRTKDFLKSKNVEFKDIDVSQDHAAAEQMVEKSGQLGVPVIDIDGKIFVGFDKEGISKELHLS